MVPACQCASGNKACGEAAFTLLGWRDLGILGKKAGKTLVTWVNATPTEHSATLEIITFQKNQTGWLLT